MKKFLKIAFIILASGSLLAIFAGCFLALARYAGEESQTGTPQAIAGSFTDAVYKADDCKNIIGLMPETLQGKVLETTKRTWNLESDEEALDFLFKPIREYRDILDKSFGEGWQFEYEVGDIEKFTDEELEDLKQQLQMMDVDGYEVKDAARANVEVRFQAVNGTAGSANFYVPVYYSRGGWYLGQYIGIGAPDPALVYLTRFGDLMDGFPIVGMFNSSGNRIDYDDEGYEITEQEDGTWIGNDGDGNVRYYDENKAFLYSDGPDGAAGAAGEEGEGGTGL